MQRLKNHISFGTQLILDFLFPKDPLTESLETLSSKDLQPLLGNPEPTDEIKGMLVIYDFKLPHTKHVIHQIKFHGNQKLIEKVSQHFYERLLEELSDKISFENFKHPLLVPIPISKKRLRDRGFNQCALIAQSLEKCDGGKNFKVDLDLLQKYKELESQIGKTRTERLKNLQNCFCIQKGKEIKGRNIILFDDVVTTGATMHEAERTLKRSGARKVWCIALAH